MLVLETMVNLNEVSDDEEEPLVVGRKRQRASTIDEDDDGGGGDVKKGVSEEKEKKVVKKRKVVTKSKGKKKGVKAMKRKKEGGSGVKRVRDPSVSMFSGMRKVRDTVVEDKVEEKAEMGKKEDVEKGGVGEHEEVEIEEVTERIGKKENDDEAVQENVDDEKNDEDLDKEVEKDDTSEDEDAESADITAKEKDEEQDAEKEMQQDDSIVETDDDDQESDSEEETKDKPTSSKGLTLSGAKSIAPKEKTKSGKAMMSLARLSKNEATEAKKSKNTKSKTTKDGGDNLHQQHACTPTWKAGEPVPYRFLAHIFSKVEAISGRLEIQAVLTQLYLAILKTTPDDLVATIYLCINKLAPAHEGVEIGVGEGALMKALSQGTGVKLADVRKKFKEIGDLGDVAAKARTTQRTLYKPPPLTVRQLYKEFMEIAKLSGGKTQSIKIGKITKLLAASTKEEAKYIARALQGKLRIHLADKTVIIGLASAVTLWGIEEGILDINGAKIPLDKDGNRIEKKVVADAAKLAQAMKDASLRITSVYNQLPVWNEIVPALIEYKQVDERISEKCKLAPGVPVAPMLAKPTKAVAEILEKFDSNFTCEYKYDGERAQIHRLQDGTINIFSRNAEDLTVKYPDLVQAIPKAIKDEHSKTTFIIDAEAVAYDVTEKRIKPFQELQSRKRKNVDVETLKVRVCVFAFDLLYFNGESLLQAPFHERREKLRTCFVDREGEFMFAEGSDCKETDEITTLLNESVKLGCEGLMVKALTGEHSTYEPANRSQNWLKVKKDYLEGIGDTLDLVPIGGYRGKGKRSSVYGAFLLACYNAGDEEYQSVCKIGTGFSEEVLTNITEYFDKGEDGSRLIDKPKSYYRLPLNSKLVPDQWFDTCQVWEVKCADLSVSPAHTGAFGMVEAGKGIGLRFPRFLRIRDDKGVEDATSAEQVVELYNKQSTVTKEYGGFGKAAASTSQ